MPTYEYQCKECGQQTEAFQKMSEAPLTECPHCHKQGLNRLVSAAGFQLKGSGWYVTDYKGKNKPSSSEEKSAEKSGGETKEQAKNSTTNDSNKATHSTTNNSNNGSSTSGSASNS